MSKLDSLFNSINNGNKEAIQDFIVATRQYVLNTARCFVNDDNDAIDIAKKVYEKIVFNENKTKESKDISQYLFSLVSQEAKNYSSNKLELIDLNNISTDVKAIEIDDSKYSKYYNDPKVEKVFYEAINSLPNEEKEIINRYYFGQESIDDIANSFNVSEEIISKYINNANSLIETASKPLFIKYKIETADYSKVAIIYSSIKKCISIANFDVLGIAADKLKDTVSKKDDEEEKDLKSFVKDILEDLVQDWFLERLKSIFAFTAIGATQEAAKNAFIKGAAKKAGTSVAKKVVIGAITAGVAVTGGVVAKNMIETKKEAEIVETTGSAIYAEMNFASVPVFVDFYSTENEEEVDKVRAEFAIDKGTVNEPELKAIEISALAMGININHYESGDSIIVEIIAKKENLGDKLLSIASSLKILSDNELNELKNMLNYNTEELTDYLYEKGYVRLFVD